MKWLDLVCQQNGSNDQWTESSHWIHLAATERECVCILSISFIIYLYNLTKLKERFGGLYLYVATTIATFTTPPPPPPYSPPLLPFSLSPLPPSPPPLQFRNRNSNQWCYQCLNALGLFTLEGWLQMANTHYQFPWPSMIFSEILFIVHDFPEEFIFYDFLGISFCGNLLHPFFSPLFFYHHHHDYHHHYHY